MRLDYDQIRLFLLDLENNSEPVSLSFSGDCAGPDYQKKHMVKCLLEKNLISCENQIKGMDGSWDLIKIEMKFDGHDFLNSVRDGKTWKKTKDIVEKSGEFSIDVIKSTAIALAVTAAKSIISGI